jgi:hypothetical protein
MISIIAFSQKMIENGIQAITTPSLYFVEEKHD